MTAAFVTHRALAYAEDGPRGPRTLDLYVPADDARRPLVIYLHGGGWVLGRRDDMSTRLLALASAGVAVASIDYTLAQDAPWPAPLEDILAAVSWLASHSAELGVRADRVVLAGASAGAHLAMLSALELSRPRGPRIPFEVAGAIGYFGSYDLTSGRPSPEPGLAAPHLPVDAAMLEELGGALPPPPRRHALLLGVAVDELDDEALARISPLHRLHAAAPPVLLLHGDQDGMVPLEQSRRFARVARDGGLSAQLVIVPGANHEDPKFDDPGIAQAVAQFLGRLTSPGTQLRVRADQGR